MTTKHFTLLLLAIALLAPSLRADPPTPAEPTAEAIAAFIDAKGKDRRKAFEQLAETLFKQTRIRAIGKETNIAPFHPKRDLTKDLILKYFGPPDRRPSEGALVYELIPSSEGLDLFLVAFEGDRLTARRERQNKP